MLIELPETTFNVILFNFFLNNLMMNLLISSTYK